MRIGLCILTVAVVWFAGERSGGEEPVATYVGSEGCVSCHPNQAASFAQTTHAASFAVCGEQSDLPTATYAHPRSLTEFQVKRRSGQLIHTQRTLDRAGNEVLSVSKPMTYVVGSGQHAKTFLYSDGDFLVQSPLTWYAENGWEMSPGYDRPGHPGMSRMVTKECLFCHVGHIDPKQGAAAVFEVTEHAIGCERCHGPGSTHNELHESGRDDLASLDAVVHPAKLTREAREAICHQCHLQAAIATTSAGGNDWDFRPGDTMAMHRTDFQYGQSDRSMKIVGHVEQLHRSACYIQTETMTCVTCHNPHQVIAPEQKIEFYRNICNDCHSDPGCGLAIEIRVTKNDNDCAACHMPAADTNVAHVAFHDHTIAVHPESGNIEPVDSTLVADPLPPSADRLATSLIPVVTDSALPSDELERRLTLAMYHLLDRGAEPIDRDHFHQQSTFNLFQRLQNGSADPAVKTMLAVDAKDMGYPDIAIDLASQAIASSRQPDRYFVRANRVLGESSFKRGEFDAAVEAFEKAAKYDRRGSIHQMMGMSLQNLGRTDEALKSLRRSIEIDPTNRSAHQTYAIVLASIGQTKLAAAHQEVAAKLQRREAALKAPTTSASR